MENLAAEIADLRRAFETLAGVVSRQADQIRALTEEVDAMSAAAAYGSESHENYGGITS